MKKIIEKNLKILNEAKIGDRFKFEFDDPETMWEGTLHKINERKFQFRVSQHEHGQWTPGQITGDLRLYIEVEDEFENMLITKLNTLNVSVRR